MKDQSKLADERVAKIQERYNQAQKDKRKTRAYKKSLKPTNDIPVPSVLESKRIEKIRDIVQGDVDQRNSIVQKFIKEMDAEKKTLERRITKQKNNYSKVRKKYWTSKEFKKSEALRVKAYKLKKKQENDIQI
jgi:hypothetical protein